MANTIYDIAKAAGVSIATVSRVFNKKGRVKESTRKKVLEVADQMGYHPQVFAQGLARKKKNKKSKTKKIKKKIKNKDKNS